MLRFPLVPSLAVVMAPCGFAAAPPPPDSALVEERRKLDRSVWAPEVDAQHHESPFIALWDSLRAAPSAWLETASIIPLSQVTLPDPGPATDLDLGITRRKAGASVRIFDAPGFRDWMQQRKREGWELAQSEWHHSRFEPATAGAPARSVVRMILHAQRMREGAPPTRAAVSANLRVRWKPPAGEGMPPAIDSIEVADLEILSRDDHPAFERVLDVESDARHATVQPLILADVDHDTLPEILAVGLNRIWRNRGKGRFDQQSLFSDDPKWIIDSGILADFTGDGDPDFLGVGQDRRVRLYAGSREGKFAGEPRFLTASVFDKPRAWSAGDADGDGDLDLFVGQYKPPYFDGSMPTPFHDANDGYPAYLFLNDGTGALTDATDASGLAPKRHRRTYAASFVDLDGDGDLDLLVTSDFSGLDLYLNDGRAHFTDVTGSKATHARLFGMAHTFGDFDLDGALDIYAIGMSSTTARRLDQLGLAHPDRPEVDAHRMAMAFGNRLLLGRDQRFVQTPLSERIARTGWSWGVTNQDFDLDGDRDLFIGNGHESGTTARDYCTKFWTHDIYTGSSRSNPEFARLFAHSLRGVGTGQESWNGFEKDVLFLNLGGNDFAEAGWLLGAASEQDSRGVASSDLDHDGRPDILVVESRGTGRPKPEFHLHLLANGLDTKNHWVGVSFDANPSPIGARVDLVPASGPRHPVWIVTGDSYSSQHPLEAHFGLGADPGPVTIEVTWPGGRKESRANLAADSWHRW